MQQKTTTTQQIHKNTQNIYNNYTHTYTTVYKTCITK